MKTPPVPTNVANDTPGIEQIGAPDPSRLPVRATPTFYSTWRMIETTLGVPRMISHGGELVYHYSDSAGLIGILESDELWATSTDYLNDPSEGFYTLNVADAILRERLSIAKTEKEKLFFNAARAALAEVKPTFYVVSFSRNQDLLSQWRGYGSFGSGFALGFDQGELSPIDEVGDLFEMIYDPDKLKAVINDLIELRLEAPGNPGDWPAEISAKGFAYDVAYLSQNCKDPAYSEEREVRLLIGQNGTPPDSVRARGPAQGGYVRYRTRGSEILPYIASTLTGENEAVRKLPLRHIVMGPGVPERNRRSLEGLLRSKGYGHVEVSQSRVPFRS